MEPGPWRSIGLATLVTLALASCDGHGVVTPSPSGVTWTRLTPVGYDQCLWPDVRFDSLAYSVLALVPVTGTELGFAGRITVSGIDGANPYVIGQPGPAPWSTLRPRWVASQRIVFQDNRSGNYDIWYQDLEDLHEWRLTNFPTNETAPAPQPGTPGLAYVELRSNPLSPYDFGRIVLIPDTAAVPIQRIYLTPDTLLSADPDWDPTGKKLTFSVLNNQDFTRHVYTMNLAPGDSLPVQITVGLYHDFHPRWSPDGKRIAFTSDRTGRWGVWIVHPSGEAQGLQILSFDDTGASVFSPAWTSDGMGLIVSSDGRGPTRGLWLLSNLPAFRF